MAHHLLLPLLLLVLPSAAVATLFGADLGEVTWSSGEAALPFADLAKQCSPFAARRWSSAAAAWQWESGAAVLWSATSAPPIGPGVPLRLVGSNAGLAAVCTIGAPNDPVNDPPIAPAYLEGDYVLLFDGVGNITVTGDASLAASSADGDASGAGFALRVGAPRAGLAIAIVATGQLRMGAPYSAIDVVRNVRIVPAAALAAAASAAALARGPASFSPRFLELARRLPLLRFAGWQKEQLNTYMSLSGLEWDNRTLPSWTSQAAAQTGVAYEHLCDLALAAGASAWISVPQAASAAYTREFAAFFATCLVLAPPATSPTWPQANQVYVEWSADPGYNAPLVAPRALSAIGYLEDGLRLALQRLSLSADGFAALRARFVFVASISQHGYLSAFLGHWAAAATAAAAAASTAASPPTKAAHPFARVDAVAFRASLAGGIIHGAGPGWEDPSQNISFFMSLSDNALLQRLRRSVLDAEVQLAGFAAWNAIAAASPSVLGLRSDLNGTAAVDFVAGLQRPLRLLAYGVGFAFAAPDFGARFARQRTPAANVTPALIAADALEQAFAARLIALHRRPELRDLTRDAYARLQASRFSAILAPDLMRPASGVTNSANFAFGLALRRSGNSAASEGWRVGGNASAAEAAAMLGAASAVSPSAAVAGFVDRVVAASPTLAALLNASAEEAAGGPPRPPLTAASLPPAAADAPCERCVYGTCFAGVCTCFSGALGAACDTLAAPADARGGAAACGAPNLGMNLGGVADYSTQLLYVDAMKQARAWIPQAGYQYSNLGWSWGALPAGFKNGTADVPVAIGDDGVAIGTMLLRDLSGHYPRGVFLVTWDGDGVVDASMDDVQSVVRDAPGRMRVTLLPTTGLNNGLFLRILRSSPLDPVRNLHAIMPFPGAHADQALLAQPDAPIAATLAAYNAALAQAGAFPFHPALLAFLRNFSTLRFMDLLDTNSGVTPSTWAARVLPTARSYAALSQGIPIEHVALLSNTIGAHAHVTVPHTGDDAYVRGMAVTLRDSLRPDLLVYLEYANEVWGTLFAAGIHAQQMGVAAQMWKLSRDPNIAASSVPYNTEARFCYYAYRSRTVYEIFKAAFAETTDSLSAASRIKLVVASQSVNPAVSESILGCNGSYVARVASVLAIAPYFGGVDPNAAPSVTPGSVFNTTLPASLAELNESTVRHAAIASAHGLALATYEAGQGMVGSTASAQALVFAVNNDARMRPVYLQYLRLLQAGGVSLINLFSSIGLISKYGAWGLVTSMDFDLKTSYKWLGVNDFAASSLQCLPFREPTACPTYDGVTCGGPARGLCVDTPSPGAGAAACACRAGFSGADCSQHALVDVSTCSYKCGFRGECVTSPVLLDGYIRQSACVCDEFYSGLGCTAFTCPKSCSFAGRCVSAGVCDCYEGFGGADCAIDCGAGGHGVCAWQSSGASQGSAAAVCDAGYAFEAAVPASTLVGPDGTSYIRGACRPVCDASCAAPRTCLRPGICTCAAPCVSGDCVSGTCLCWAGFGGPTCARRMSAAEAAASNALGSAYSPVGINLAGIAYWSTETPFCDLVVTSSAWLSQYKVGLEPPGGSPWDRVDVRPNISASTGWPVALGADQAIGILFARDVKQALPSGRYEVSWEGSATLSFGFDAARVLVHRRGYALLDVRLSTVRDNGIFIRVEDMDERDPLRRLRVILPTGDCPARAASGFPFHADYISLLRTLGVGALRFMDMMSTNNFAADAPTLTWAERPTLETMSFGHGTGVPAEHMVHLANVLGADAWFTMPHPAAEDYWRGFATLVKGSLRSDLAVFLERSNECWNALFGCGAGAYAEARRRGLFASTVHAEHSAAMAAAWRAVWSAAPAAPQRLVHVLSTQTVNSWITSMMLANASQLAGVDALGVTAYIDCGGLGSESYASVTAQQSLDWLFAQCAAALPAINMSWAGQAAAVSAALAAAGAAGQGRQIPLAVYEGGPGLVEQAMIEHGGESTPGLLELFTAAARDPRMETTYRAYLDSFRALGLADGRGAAPPFMHFSSGGAISKYGAWGLVEKTGAQLSDSPKARALAGFARDIVAALTPAGCLTPGALNFNPAAVFTNDSCTFPPVPVSASGAVLAPAGVGVTLTVPPGAVAGGASVAITVAQVPIRLGAAAGGGGASGGGVAALDSTGEREIVSGAFAFGPVGTQFATPVRVCVPMDNASIAYATAPAAGGASTAALSLYSSSDGGATWELAAASALEGGALCGGLSHFTIAAGLRVSAATLAADTANASVRWAQPAAPAAGKGTSAAVAGGAAAAALLLSAAAAAVGWRWHAQRRKAAAAVSPEPRTPSSAV